MTQKYDDSSIEILEGLEAVRKRPGMYIGSVDARGLHHLVWEIVDNAIDEALNGFGNEIIIEINKDGSCTVTDFGRGMPVGTHKSGKNTLQVIFTVLHAGGKFSDQGGYKTAGGLHGVGASVVNALSEWLEVEVCRDKKRYLMRFENGGKKVSKLQELGPTNRTGSKVTFMPDKRIFQTTVFNYQTILERAQEEAFLLKNVKLTVKDLRSGEEQSFLYNEGLKAFMDYLHEDKDVLHETVCFHGEKDRISADIAFQYTDSYQEYTFSYVNLVRTSDGGTHEVGYKSAFTKVINEFARENGLLKEKDKNFEGSDVREGLTSIISCSIPESILQFEGQTKGKLGTPEAKTVIDSIVSEQLTYYLHENKEIAIQLIKKIQRASLAREAARKAKDEARSGKKSSLKSKEILSGKLAPAQTRDSSKLELFLVEGDSAGGSAKKCRDSSFQAILPLRGKVLNTERASISEIEKNEELNTIVHCIGAGVGPHFNIDDIHYDKVVIMTDADTDGAHIQVLLLTFFYRFMRELIETGHVYIAMPPLYGVMKNKERIYLYSDEELNEMKKELGDRADIQRYKGLGEMDADQLWDTTMDPERRTLIQVSIEDAALCERKISVLMGNNAEIRRKWIDDNIDFTLEEDYRVTRNG
ncbi:MAG: DNA topoisomerase IV subunit B [Erysipelotrichaceae bacterium]|nr:DNA topoisomerase IV subunit B [Erysipelotrichaceae bacterium]